MKVTKRQLRRIIREAMGQRKYRPWFRKPPKFPKDEWKIGDKVVANGYPGVIEDLGADGMVEVRLKRGVVAVDGSTIVRQPGVPPLNQYFQESYHRILAEDASEASYLDFDPIVIEIPALEKALSNQLTDSPEGKGFSQYDASSIADVLEGSEPDIEDFDYDEDEFKEAKTVWDAAVEAGAEPEELATSIRQAVKDADDAGYEY